jgi:hypothetical protein
VSLDRAEISRALTNAIAYKQCGKQVLAELWARELVHLLECADILADTETTGVQR